MAVLKRSQRVGRAPTPRLLRTVRLASVTARFIDHSEVGVDVRQIVERTVTVLRDPVSRERAESTFGTLVDRAGIGRVLNLWRDDFSS